MLISAADSGYADHVGVSAMTVIVDTCASPTPLRRTVVRALTTLGLTAGAWLAISLASADANAGPIDGLSGVVQDVSGAAGQVTGGVATAAQPVQLVLNMAVFYA